MLLKIIVWEKNKNIYPVENNVSNKSQEFPADYSNPLYRCFIKLLDYIVFFNDKMQ